LSYKFTYLFEVCQGICWLMAVGD